MAKRQDGVQLTGLQLEVLQILWDREEASVAQVHEALAGRGRKMAYTTAMTLCRRMAKRGLLTFYERGELKLDEMVTRTYALADVGKAFDDMHAGRNAKGVLICAE